MTPSVLFVLALVACDSDPHGIAAPPSTADTGSAPGTDLDTAPSPDTSPGTGTAATTDTAVPAVGCPVRWVPPAVDTVDCVGTKFYDTFGDGVADSAIVSVYDGAGRVIEEPYDENNDGVIDSSTTFVYDPTTGALVERRSDGNMDGIADHVTTYTYDATGQLTSEVLVTGGGSTTHRTTYTYGPCGVATNAHDLHDDGSTDVLRTYTWTPTQRTTVVDYGPDGVPEWSETDAYDPVTGAWIEHAIDAGVQYSSVGFEYDPEGFLTEQTWSLYEGGYEWVSSVTVSYDPDGRPLELWFSVDGGPAALVAWHTWVCP